VAGDDDDLRINTLHRFAKHSPRLILEEYSHCEVPAGCGGVVIRWLDPVVGLPASLRMIGPRATLWLDGVEVATSRLPIQPGVHVLAAEVSTDKPDVVALELYFRGEPRGRDIIAAWRHAPATAAPGAFDDTWPAAVPAPEERLAALRWRRGIDDAIAHGQLAVAIEPGTTRLRARVEATP
jgi:hypothetical protein